MLEELGSDKFKIKVGGEDSSGGSDSAPSDDNLDDTELILNLPEIDQQVKLKLNKETVSLTKEPTSKN